MPICINQLHLMLLLELCCLHGPFDLSMFLSSLGVVTTHFFLKSTTCMFFYYCVETYLDWRWTRECQCSQPRRHAKPRLQFADLEYIIACTRC